MTTFNTFNDILREYGEDTTTNFDLIKIAKDLEIPNFHVLMRDELKILNKLLKDDVSLNVICNLHTKDEKGIHWSCLHIDNHESYWFDSYAIPPLNRAKNAHRNYFVFQKSDKKYCGQMCIYVLYKLNNGISFDDIVIDLYDSI